MQNTSDQNGREAKVISIHENENLSPQIPEHPIHQGILQLHTLELINNLLDEHFK